MPKERTKDTRAIRERQRAQILAAAENLMEPTRNIRSQRTRSKSTREAARRAAAAIEESLPLIPGNILEDNINSQTAGDVNGITTPDPNLDNNPEHLNEEAVPLDKGHEDLDEREAFGPRMRVAPRGNRIRLPVRQSSNIQRPVAERSPEINTNSRNSTINAGFQSPAAIQRENARLQRELEEFRRQQQPTTKVVASMDIKMLQGNTLVYDDIKRLRDQIASNVVNNASIDRYSFFPEDLRMLADMKMRRKHGNHAALSHEDFFESLLQIIKPIDKEKAQTKDILVLAQTLPLRNRFEKNDDELYCQSIWGALQQCGIKVKDLNLPENAELSKDLINALKKAIYDPSKNPRAYDYPDWNRECQAVMQRA